MVWVGMSREALTELAVFVIGTLTALRFVKKDVTQNLMVFAGFIRPELVLIYDNCRPHTAVIAREHLSEIGISPAYSPDCILLGP